MNNAGREEKTSVREDRRANARVFTVGGSRGGTPGNRYDTGESFCPRKGKYCVVIAIGN